MAARSASGETPISGLKKVKEGNILGIPISNIVSHFGTSGVSVAAATGITHPLDVLKVRLQMQLVGQRGPLIGMVRLQMNATSSKGPLQELQRIAHEEGMAALWKGVGPAMARASALTASQLATYDESKQALMRWTPLEEGFYLHLISSTIAGAVSTLMTAPMDMVKTRLMLQRESKQVGMYKNGFHCAYQVLHTEGPRGLYKGGLTLFARLGPQTTITFIICEKLRELAGLKAI